MMPTAVFTQATWTINDKFGLVLGARYAEDEKEWYEIRGGYSELFMNFSGAWDSVMALQAGQVGPYYEQLGYMPWSGAVSELTPLAYANLIMGNAILYRRFLVIQLHQCVRLKNKALVRHQ